MIAAERMMSGGCQCGRIRYEVRIERPDAYLCHCRMCRRATGGAFAAFVNVAKADVRWTREPDWYQSSRIAHRPFCSACGTPLGFAFPDGDKMDLTVGSFDAPDYFVPTSHFAVETRLDHWTDTRALPGSRIADYKPLVDRWVKAAGAVPD